MERDGQEVALGSFGGRLARQLLRLLALRRGTLVPKDLIADALWGGDPPADPAGNIEVLVSRIRRVLGDRTLIRTGPGGYLLADGGRCRVDAEEFLAAVQAGRAALTACPADGLASFRAALGIWRGEPLPEDTYADWARADRQRLSLAYLEALDGAATAALDSPGAAAAAEATMWARQALAAEPLRESSVLVLVRALAAAGDQAGALAAFDEYRDLLAVETGLEPTPRAREIRQHVLAGRPALDAGDFDRAATLRGQERQLLDERARRLAQWSAGVDAAALAEEIDRLHQEVGRLRDLLIRNGIHPGEGHQHCLSGAPRVRGRTDQG